MELDIYMERIISQEERIRRAEELYYKRKNQTGVRVSTATVNLKENKCTLGKKMIIQLLVCLSIYMCIHIIKTNNTIISEQLISEINKILSYDINFQKLYSKCIEEVGKYYSFTTIEENKHQVDNYVDNIFINRIKQDYIIEKKEEPPLSEEIKTDVGIGGGSEIVEQNINKSQMELDAEYIKQNYNFIKPVEGIITSRYGNRQPTEIVSAFHQGIDIGAVIGTTIYASMEGTVIASSWAGDYGKHIKIQNGDVLTVYAHCSELVVSVGDYVRQGQVIGKVGNTRKGNRTSFAF